jgi:hypothetical protein
MDKVFKNDEVEAAGIITPRKVQHALSFLTSGVDLGCNAGFAWKVLLVEDGVKKDLDDSGLEVGARRRVVNITLVEVPKTVLN